MERLGTRRELKEDDVGMSGKYGLLFSQVSRKSLSENETWWTVKNWKQNNGGMFGKQAAVWVKCGEWAKMKWTGRPGPGPGGFIRHGTGYEGKPLLRQENGKNDLAACST